MAAPLSSPTPFTVIADSGKGDYNCTWSPDGTKIAYTEDYAGNGEIFMENSDGSSIFPINLTNAAGVFDGNPDWAPDGRPVCPDTAAATTVNTPVTITVTCTDTGPAYEQSDVREFKQTDPAHGTVTQDLAGDPFVYTPNQGFTGTDSFQISSFDDFGFGGDNGIVTITVNQVTPPPPPPPPNCAGQPATIFGTAGDNTLNGTSRADVIAGLGGNDTILAAGGNDIICGGSGRDRIGGGRGKDRASGGKGADRISGNRGNDRLTGRSGNDRLRGGSGRDRLVGNSGRDRLLGGPGPDRLSAGPGRDRLDGGANRDVCRGGPNRDVGIRCELSFGVEL